MELRNTNALTRSQSLMNHTVRAGCLNGFVLILILICNGPILFGPISAANLK
jgi:hypothetical protein